MTSLNKHRVVSNDPFAVLEWIEEPKAVGGGYWWPEAVEEPGSVRVHGIELVFLPYIPIGASSLMMDESLHWGSKARRIVSRRTVKNRPLVAGPGECYYHATAIADEGLLILPTTRSHPDDPAELSWSWERDRGSMRVALWLLPEHEDEFRIAMAMAALEPKK